MALGWNEVKERAVRFSKEWEHAFNEEADAKQFLIEFFNVFGISNRRVATFEHRVKKLGDADGYIDLLWKGTMLIEMKSRGKNLDKAYQQAIDYTHGLKDVELPKYILVSDFATFRLYDLDENQRYDFSLADLVSHVQLFGFIAGYQKRTYKDEDPVNIRAAERMGKLHDALKDSGYTGHELERYLVRLLFCLFAEDTTIFEKGIFQDYIITRTNEDGTDLGVHIAQLFQILNTPPEKRQKNLDESLTIFPYVNGNLFAEQLTFASFNSKMRQSLLECCELDWGKISPAIFGSMFQSVMDKNARRNLGVHYTSEKNILKLIKPLFLDNLWKEFENAKNNENKLRSFHRKIASLRFLDPACGCGNFLVITYRELRLLELAILKSLQKGQRVIDLESLMQCNVDSFYGIEYEEFPSQIAQVALWLIDHQMNMMISQEFGEYFVRLPLKKSAMIVHGNALQIDWQTLLNPVNAIDIVAKHTNIYLVNEPVAEFKSLNVKTETYHIHKGQPPLAEDQIKFDYILGNPPFIGSRIMDIHQKHDLITVFENTKNTGDLDYVTAWYIKAAKYIQHSKIKVAFVSTNSIVQGLQTSILWKHMLNKYGIKIHFAHRTFKWSNEAKGNAAVYCIIVGFANYETNEKSIFEYDNIKGEAHEIKVQNINPYLLESKDILIDRQQNPICNVPEMSFGNMPADGGELLFTSEEKKIFLEKEPNALPFFRKFLGSYEFINNVNRWCLWLQDIDPSELNKMKLVLERVRNVKVIREKSSRPQLANTPHLFAQITQPKGLDYIIVPSVSSERRKYIPIGFEKAEVIASNLCLIIPKATIFHFGVLTSAMHMAWVKTTCGRLKSDFRYSKDIVYNNFPWPENPSEKQKETIETAAQKVLDVRAGFPGASLADLYNPLTMPPALVKAHNDLDKAVDLAYRPQPFINETKRIEYLFELYDKYTAGLFPAEKKKGKK